jgi:Family of unknown function (DUF6011)
VSASHTETLPIDGSSKLQMRCCMCGKGLTTDESKVIGIGPECRKGLPKEFVDNYLPPKVGKVHYEDLF